MKRLNIYGLIKKLVKEGKGVQVIKHQVLLIKPDYETYWVEEYWVRHQLETLHRPPLDVFKEICLHKELFHKAWYRDITKISKFLSKIVQEPAVTGTTIREIATGMRGLDEERTFGIEIEFNRPMQLSWNEIIKRLGQIQIHVETADRTDYANTSCWRLTNDGSVQVPFDLMHSHAGGNEMKSPILRGIRGIEEVKKILSVLRGGGCVVNNSCGLHVHHGFKSKDDAENARIIHNACLLYHKYKSKIAKMLPADRRHNKYCRNFRPSEIDYLNLRYGHKLNESVNNSLGFCQNRMRAVNVEAYFTHSTLEFRQHSGTLDESKTINWILFTQAFMNTAEDYFRRNVNLTAHNYGPLHRELGLSNELKTYYEQRVDCLKITPTETEYVGLCHLTPRFRGRPHRPWLRPRR